MILWVFILVGTVIAIALRFAFPEKKNVFWTLAFILFIASSLNFSAGHVYFLLALSLPLLFFFYRADVSLSSETPDKKGSPRYAAFLNALLPLAALVLWFLLFLPGGSFAFLLRPLDSLPPNFSFADLRGDFRDHPEAKLFFSVSVLLTIVGAGFFAYEKFLKKKDV